MNPKPLRTAFTEAFGIAYPIVGAPMFLVSTVKLVVAVSESGGLGTFPALNFRPIEAYREAIREIKRQTTKPFGINIIVQKSNKAQREHLNIALEEGVPLIITSLGHPKDVIREAHQTKTKVYCDVIGLHHARKVADAGADGLIAVASGAGGHAGTLSPFALIPELKANLKLPVLAAGSIVDGRGLAAALALGADGIYMGTRFIASSEAEVDPAYKAAILKAHGEDIVSTHRVDGFPGNFILTPELEVLGVTNAWWENLLSASPRAQRLLAMSRAARTLFYQPRGKVSYKTIFSAGHGVGRIGSLKSVRAIVEDTVDEYRALLQAMPR